MSNIFLGSYVLLGLVTALATMRVFPPMEGFRPKLSLRVLALTVFTLLWPVLISLALWYLGLGYLHRNRKHTTDSRIGTVELVNPEPLPGLQASKPR